MARGESIDARADIYELGIVLFQMLSGHVPFKGNTPLAVVVKHLEEALPPLHQANPTIPAALDRVVQIATAKRREDRYRTAGELAQALRRAITSPDYSQETIARDAPTVFEPQPTILPPPPQGSQPSAGRSINFATTSATDRPRIENEPLTPGAYIAPVTPYPPPEPTTQRGPRPWLLIAAALVIIVLVFGGVFFGLHLGGPSMPAQPTTTQVLPTPTTSSAQLAQSVVQQYYSDINNKDYQSAYNLWGPALKKTQSESSFASGYKNTVQDNVTINNVLTLTNGSVRVNITLHSTDQTPSGPPNPSTYQGYWIVGQENGAWKLLSSNISRTA